MVAFVLEQNIKHNGEYEGEEMVNLLIKLYGNTVKYANFLSRQPQLSDFVPCGEDGLPLKMPIIYDGMDSDALLDEKKYLQALDKVLFKGFWLRCPNAVTNGNISITFTKSGGILLDKYYQDHTENISTITTLESLTPYNLELTDNAIKIIGV